MILGVRVSKDRYLESNNEHIPTEKMLRRQRLQNLINRAKHYELFDDKAKPGSRRK